MEDAEFDDLLGEIMNAADGGRALTVDPRTVLEIIEYLTECSSERLLKIRQRAT